VLRASCLEPRASCLLSTGGDYKAHSQHPGFPRKAAACDSPFLSPPPLRLPLPPNTTHPGQIRHRRPRRLRALNQIQMARPQSPPHILRRPFPHKRQKAAPKERSNAQSNHQNSTRNVHRPHQPQRPRQQKGKPPTRNLHSERLAQKKI